MMRQHRADAAICRSKSGTSAPRSISRAITLECPIAVPRPSTAAATTMLYSRKPRRPREVRRRLALAREPVRPVGVPSEIVQQGPVMQVGRVAGPSARLEKGRTADRKQIFLVQRLLEQPLRARRSGLADVGDPDIEIASRGSTPRWSVSNSMTTPGWDNWKSASLGKSHFSATTSTETSFSRCVPESARRRSVATWISARNALDILQIRLAAPVQADTTMAALEKRAVEMLFQYLDAVRTADAETWSSSAALAKLSRRAAASKKRRHSSGGRGGMAAGLRTGIVAHWIVY